MIYLYESAHLIQRGDILPDVSRSPVARVIVHPASHVRVIFEGTTFTRDYPHGGPDFGFAAARITRPI